MVYISITGIHAVGRCCNGPFGNWKPQTVQKIQDNGVEWAGCFHIGDVPDPRHHDLCGLKGCSAR